MNEIKSCYEKENDEKNISDLDKLNTHFIFNALN